MQTTNELNLKIKIKSGKKNPLKIYVDNLFINEKVININGIYFNTTDLTNKIYYTIKSFLENESKNNKLC